MCVGSSTSVLALAGYESNRCFAIEHRSSAGCWAFGDVRSQVCVFQFRSWLCALMSHSQRCRDERLEPVVCVNGFNTEQREQTSGFRHKGKERARLRWKNRAWQRLCHGIGWQNGRRGRAAAPQHHFGLAFLISTEVRSTVRLYLQREGAFHHRTEFPHLRWRLSGNVLTRPIIHTSVVSALPVPNGGFK